MRHLFKRLSALLIATFILTGCDWLNMRRCEWYFTPFPEGETEVETGTVSVCVTSFKLGKKKCYFQITPELVEKFNGVPFRYVDLDFTKTHPKVVTDVTRCEP